jgi:hypothetical protein
MAKAKPRKVDVTMRSVIQRINRKLAADNEVLRVAKGERVRLQVGHYFVLDLEIGGILHQDVDPEALARELGVLRDYEEVVE